MIRLVSIYDKNLNVIYYSLMEQRVDGWYRSPFKTIETLSRGTSTFDIFESMRSRLAKRAEYEQRQEHQETVIEANTLEDLKYSVPWLFI